MAGYSVSIRAEDGATAVINRVNASLARMTAPVTNLAKATRTLSDRTGLTRLTAGFQSAASGAQRLGGHLSTILPMFGVLTGAASLAGMARLVTTWAEFGSGIGKAANRLDISARALGAWQVGARLAGASMAGMTDGLTSLRDTLTDAVGGRNNEAVQYLNILGVQFRNAAGGARDFEDVLPELAERIKALRDPTLQARVAAVFFGGAAAELLPILRDGAAGIDRMRREGMAFSRTNADQVQRAQALGRAWRGLDVAASQAGNAIASALAPALTPLLDRLTSWVQSSDGLSGWIERMATRIDAWVARGGPKELGDQIADIASNVNAVVQAFGGWEVAAISLAAVLTARLLAPLARVAATLAGIAAIRVPAWLLAMLGVSGTAVAGGAAAMLYSRPAGETRSDQDLLERLRQDPEAARREMEGGAMQRPPEQRSVAGRIQDLFRPRYAPPPASAPRAQPGNPSEPRGIRNNNPLNLMFHPAQLGTNPGLQSDGRFGVYPTMEDGVAQSIRQMQRHAGRGDDTLARLMSRWAPPNENNTAGYIAGVSRATGLGPNDTLNLRDPETLRRLVQAMSVQENGRSLDPAVVDRGVGLALGAPVATVGAAGGGGQAGRVEVDVTLRGAGPGTTADTRASGAASAPPARIERAMPGVGGP